MPVCTHTHTPYPPVCNYKHPLGQFALELFLFEISCGRFGTSHNSTHPFSLHIPHLCHAIPFAKFLVAVSNFSLLNYYCILEYNVREGICFDLAEIISL